VFVIPARGRENRPFFFTVYKLYLSFKMPLFRIILKFERHIVVILCTKVFQVCVIFNFYFYTTCSVLRIICFMKMREGEGAKFFCMRSLLSKENGESFPASCAFLRLQGGFSKSFLHIMLYTVKKMCGFPVPSQDVKHSLTY